VTEPILDYDGYEKSLEKILEGVTKDYYSSFLDINRHQVMVSRAYLWVSAALIGVYAAVYEKFSSVILMHSCLFLLSLFALLFACAGFGICLYSIPARKGYMAIPKKGWGEFSRGAYDLLKDNNPKVYSTFLSTQIARIDTAYAYNFQTNLQRATLLRVTSWILISSFALALISSTIAIIDSLNISQQKVTTHMSNENNDTQASSVPAPSPQLLVPEPPPSADIGTGGIISTHSAERVQSHTAFATDNAIEKK
jgi:hypothetical protein